MKKVPHLVVAVLFGLMPLTCLSQETVQLFVAYPTSYLFDSTTPEEELITSGLLGPVTIKHYINK